MGDEEKKNIDTSSKEKNEKLNVKLDTNIRKNILFENSDITIGEKSTIDERCLEQLLPDPPSNEPVLFQEDKNDRNVEENVDSSMENAASNENGDIAQKVNEATADQ